VVCGTLLCDSYIVLPLFKVLFYGVRRQTCVLAICICIQIGVLICVLYVFAYKLVCKFVCYMYLYPNWCANLCAICICIQPCVLAIVLYSKRTHSTAREHILQQENTFYLCAICICIQTCVLAVVQGSGFRLCECLHSGLLHTHTHTHISCQQKKKNYHSAVLDEGGCPIEMVFLSNYLSRRGKHVTKEKTRHKRENTSQKGKTRHQGEIDLSIFIFRMCTIMYTCIHGTRMHKT